MPDYDRAAELLKQWGDEDPAHDERVSALLETTESSDADDAARYRWLKQYLDWNRRYYATGADGQVTESGWGLKSATMFVVNGSGDPASIDVEIDKARNPKNRGTDAVSQ